MAGLSSTRTKQTDGDAVAPLIDKFGRQISYLTVRAEGVLDIRDNGVTPLDADQVRDLIETWAEDFNGKTNYGYTRHMIVSFPEGTYPDAAHEAGLEFTDRLFGSGDFGDTWEFVDPWRGLAVGRGEHAAVDVEADRRFDHLAFCDVDRNVRVGERRELLTESVLLQTAA